MITAQYNTKTALHNGDFPANDEKIMVYLNIPSMSGYKLKAFDRTMTVEQIIAQLNNNLPDHLKSDRYYLYHNYIRLFDQNKTLVEHNIKNLHQLELKRGNEFEFSTPSGVTFSIEGETQLSMAAKRLGRVGFPDHKKSHWDYALNHGRISIVLDEHKFHTLKLRNGDIIEIRAQPKRSKDVAASLFVTVIYSPFEAREAQKNSFQKQGYLKKQGGNQGGTKNWKKRWFVLGSEKLEYFLNKNAFKDGKKALGDVHMQDFISVETDEMREGKFMPHTFVISTASRVLYCKAETNEIMAEWISSIDGMGNLARSDIIYDNENIRSIKLQEQFARSELSQTGHKGISDVYGFSLKTRINSDWQWTGDIHPNGMFTIGECLGVGASAKVYKAIHNDAGFDIAIKIIHNADQKFLENMEKEIEVLKSCQSPLVVAYYGTYVDPEEQDVWILMDYCGAGSVKDVMKIVHETLTEAQCGYVIQQSLAGLVYLHAQNILHLDIKCGNILLSLEGDVKLADFGVSEQLKNIELDFVEASDYVGSPLFMAPEVIRKTGYNNKADIWSLGITIIEMFDGRPPNTDITSIEQLPEIAERDPPTFKSIRGLSMEFISFLSACLTKNVEERPSANELFGHEFLRTVKTKDALLETINEAYQLSQNNKYYGSMSV